MLSRIDGSATTQDLADLTSLDTSEVERTIAKLIELGAVEWADGTMALPRTSLRPPTPAEGIKRFAVPASPRPPLVTSPVLESEPPVATREPTPQSFPAAPRIPSAGLPSAGSGALTETVRDTDRMGSAIRADGGSSVASATARVGLRAQPADGIDLTPERRARIDELYVTLDLRDHYEVLGVPHDADAKVIRAAYFELSKVFHPDTAFRKNLGAYKTKMEAIFSRLTEAYDVLGKKKARAEYDSYLGLQSALREAEAAMGIVPSTPPEAAVPAPPPEAEPAAVPAAASPPAPEPEPAPDARTSMSEEGKRRARKLAQKRLGGAFRPPGSAPGATGPSAGPAPAPEPAATPRARQDVLRDLASSLKGAAAQTGGLDAVQRHMMNARRHEQQGDLAAAAKELRQAVAVAPERFDVTSEQQRVAKLLAAQLADQYAKQAEYEERHRKWPSAALSWAKVVEGRPGDAPAHMRAAAALLEAKGDLHKAQRLAQRACDLAPEDAAARRTLGRVFLAAGLHLNARRELEKAAALDPSDPVVKNLLRDLPG